MTATTPMHSRLVVPLAVLVASACGSKKSPPPPTGTRIGPALVAAFDEAARASEPWRCGASDAPGLTDATLTAGKRTWKLAGHTISTTDGALSIGFVADAGGAADATVQALARLRAKLGAVDLVVALGGMGTTRAQLEATLGALAGDVLVVALPGDLEDAGALSAAVGKLAAGGNHVVDGRLVRRIAAGSTTIATLSGAPFASRLVAGAEGCAYAADDIVAVYAELSASEGLRILAATAAPRVIVDGEPAGDRALEPSAGQAIDLIVHAPVEQEATAARTGGRDGKAVALSPGTSDATVRLGPRAAPSAGVLTISTAPLAWRWRAVVDEPRR